MNHEWTCAASGPRAENLPGNILDLKENHPPLLNTNTPHHSLLLGNIKDLPKSITNLNLVYCEMLEGR